MYNKRVRNASSQVCCSVLQCVAVCCSVLQCVAVCCSVLCTKTISHSCPSNRTSAGPRMWHGLSAQRTATHCNTQSHECRDEPTSPHPHGCCILKSILESHFVTSTRPHDYSDLEIYQKVSLSRPLAHIIAVISRSIPESLPVTSSHTHDCCNLQIHIRDPRLSDMHLEILEMCIGESCY